MTTLRWSNHMGSDYQLPKVEIVEPLLEFPLTCEVNVLPLKYLINRGRTPLNIIQKKFSSEYCWSWASSFVSGVVVSKKINLQEGNYVIVFLYFKIKYKITMNLDWSWVVYYVITNPMPMALSRDFSSDQRFRPTQTWTLILPNQIRQKYKSSTYKNLEYIE